jgi:hypothetical protein
MAAALAAAGRLPLLSAKESIGSGIDASTGPYAVKPIRDHLSRFLPVQIALNRKQYATVCFNLRYHSLALGQRET